MDNENQPDTFNSKHIKTQAQTRRCSTACRYRHKVCECVRCSLQNRMWGKYTTTPKTPFGGRGRQREREREKKKNIERPIVQYLLQLYTKRCRTVGALIPVSYFRIKTPTMSLAFVLQQTYFWEAYVHENSAIMSLIMIYYVQSWILIISIWSAFAPNSKICPYWFIFFIIFLPPRLPFLTTHTVENHWAKASKPMILETRNACAAWLRGSARDRHKKKMEVKTTEVF